MARLVCIVVASAVFAGCAHPGGSPALPPGLGVQPATSVAVAFKSLYSFKTIPDGMEPAGGMVVLNGTLYGTTQVGGQGDAGTVFASSTAGKERVLYSFGMGGGPDGVFPLAGLVVLNGTLYGTASSGGQNGFGAVFKVTKSGKESLLYSFKGGQDGSEPYAGLTVYKGALYGTTIEGGGSSKCTFGCGTVFEVTTAGKEHVVYAFKGANDGAAPVSNVIVVNSALFGTTPDGGKNGVGTIFKTSLSGKEQVLHSFGTGFDASAPDAGLVDFNGKLYGTTNNGGQHFNGTVFSATTAGGEHVIYDFKGGSDGANPEASLVALKSTLYGTTAGGGSANSGTVFSVKTSGSESVVHAFKGGADGADPRAPLVANAGSLYGTTAMGGASQVGTIFKVTP
jgi:uncharacterized repeat protein (TIGR03803 family)